MNTQVLLIISIGFNVAGILLMFFNSPKIITGVNGGNASSDFKKIKKVAKRKNRLSKLGLILIIIGIAIQLYLTII